MAPHPGPSRFRDRWREGPPPKTKETIMTERATDHHRVGDKVRHVDHPNAPVMTVDTTGDDTVGPLYLCEWYAPDGTFHCRWYRSNQLVVVEDWES